MEGASPLVLDYCLLILFQSRDTPTQRIIVNESSSRRPERIEHRDSAC